MRKIIFSSALITAILFLSSCATIFGGRITDCQKRKPAIGEPRRRIKTGALIGDIYFGLPLLGIPVAIDFLTKAIYQPCDVVNSVPIKEAPSKRQDSTITNSKWLSVSICPTEMVSGFETIYLDYKFSKHISLGIGAGHIFPWGHAIITGDEPAWSAYNGTIVRANAKYFFNDKGFYIGLIGTYKNLYYSWQNFANYYKDAGIYYYNKSETASLFGANIFFGREKRISKYIDLELFMGIGINFRNRDYTVNSARNEYNYMGFNRPIPGHFTENNILFSIPIGMKIGFLHAKK